MLHDAKLTDRQTGRAYCWTIDGAGLSRADIRAEMEQRGRELGTLTSGRYAFESWRNPLTLERFEDLVNAEGQTLAGLWRTSRSGARFLLLAEWSYSS